MIDTHSHIYLPEFDQDRDEVVARAKAAGVEHVVLPNVDVSTIGPLKNTLKTYPGFCSGAAGLHPTSVGADYGKRLEDFEKELANGGYVAVGEIGIDLYWDKTFYKEQAAAFEVQLKWAEQSGLPVIIHARESLEEIVRVINKTVPGHCRGVFHSFTGNREQVWAIRNSGDFLFGINGIVTFKNSSLPQVLPEIGIENIVLETDAPYLSPVPYRGKRNEPSFLPYICCRLGVIFGLPPEEVERITTANARRLFGEGRF